MGAPFLSRRALLAAVAAAPAACVVPLTAAPSEWHRLKQRMIDTLAAERHYDNTIAIPAWKAEEDHGAYFDEAITHESDRVMGLRLAA